MNLIFRRIRVSGRRLLSVRGARRGVGVLGLLPLQPNAMHEAKRNGMTLRMTTPPGAAHLPWTVEHRDCRALTGSAGQRGCSFLIRKCRHRGSQRGARELLLRARELLLPGLVYDVKKAAGAFRRPSCCLISPSRHFFGSSPPAQARNFHWPPSFIRISVYLPLTVSRSFL
jgi:hypothetical protein